MEDLTSIRLAGRRLPLDLKAWTLEDRLAAGVTLAGITVILLVGAVVSSIVVPGWIPLIILLLAAVVVAFHGAVDFLGFRSAPASATVPAPPPLPVVTLRCGECATIFDLEDPGFRPVYHVCPGCGTHGVLEDAKPPTPAEEGPAILDYSAPAPPAPVAEVPPPPPPLEPAPAPPADPYARYRPPPAGGRKFKHTCKGCGAVAVVVDTGERPMPHTCAQCGRKAKLALKD